MNAGNDFTGGDSGLCDGQAGREQGAPYLLGSDFAENEIFEERGVDEAWADKVNGDTGTRCFVLKIFSNAIKSRLGSAVGG